MKKPRQGRGCDCKPKKTFKSKGVEGYDEVEICQKCYSVHNYIQSEEEIKSDKIIEHSEEEIKKLIAEADKKKQKKVKKQQGEQSSLNF